MFDIPEWPYFLGRPAAHGLIRSRPEDFIVEEVPRIEPGGHGDHLWLWVEKRGANTDWVAMQLAKAAGCDHRDVGYAGLKDRHAVTRQWFSLPGGEPLLGRIGMAGIEGVSILDHGLHARKLKRGTLEGNRFDLVVREFDGDVDKTAQRLEDIRLSGVPNYFGPQRFGRDGQNVNRAFKLLSGKARMPRNKRSIYLSALRSFLFNQVLADRIREGSWNRIMEGEAVMLDGTHSIFVCEMVDAEIEDRARRMDIHPTGPLPGEGGMQPQAPAADAERVVLSHWQMLTDLLKSQRVKADRRALRLYPRELHWDLNDGLLRLSFALPAGAYATTVLREVLVASDTAGKKTDQAG